MPSLQVSAVKKACVNPTLGDFPMWIYEIKFLSIFELGRDIFPQVLLLAIRTVHADLPTIKVGQEQI